MAKGFLYHKPCYFMSISYVIQILYIFSEILYWHINLNIYKMQLLMFLLITGFASCFLIAFHGSTNSAKLEIFL